MIATLPFSELVFLSKFWVISFEFIVSGFQKYSCQLITRILIICSENLLKIKFYNKLLRQALVLTVFLRVAAF